MLILNIGLKRGDALLNVASVKAALYARIPGMVSCGTYDSDTEPTLVAIAPAGAVQYRTLYAIADQLGQDCIAVYCTEMQRGHLYGPRADAWGQFEPQYFIMPDGQRLGS